MKLRTILLELKSIIILSKILSRTVVTKQEFLHAKSVERKANYLLKFFNKLEKFGIKEEKKVK